ncbi:MAG: splicing factor 3B subunit 10-domain-containing protein [Olpidium bornovanus]|uniref:Splicing factor 3B subunit 10-domain-containing protein n=1 Tax=Olpidium bornovanus TaxID=278681 RepID=A0A8H8DF59_9FUNG|nr:MAG: splicing factor 3B subunit 10-domain-containing protein [Olpidium bornovanus]
MFVFFFSQGGRKRGGGKGREGEKHEPSVACRFLNLSRSVTSRHAFWGAGGAFPPNPVQSKYVGTGHADTVKYEWLVNQHRDSIASYLGHHHLLTHFAIAENEAMACVRFELLEVKKKKKESVAFGGSDQKENRLRTTARSENARPVRTAAETRRLAGQESLEFRAKYKGRGSGGPGFVFGAQTGWFGNPYLRTAPSTVVAAAIPKNPVARAAVTEADSVVGVDRQNAGKERMSPICHGRGQHCQPVAPFGVYGEFT